MNIKKFLSVLLAVLMLASIVAACQSADEGTLPPATS